jgi:hypothetical protein
MMRLRRGQVERWPAVATLCYETHTLLVLKPWLGFVKHRRLVGTRGDQDDSFFGLPMHEQREVLELLNMVDTEDDGENGGLINTL